MLPKLMKSVICLVCVHGAVLPEQRLHLVMRDIVISTFQPKPFGKFQRCVTVIGAHIDLGPVRQQHLGNLGLVERCGPVSGVHP